MRKTWKTKIHALGLIFCFSMLGVATANVQAEEATTCEEECNEQHGTCRYNDSGDACLLSSCSTHSNGINCYYTCYPGGQCTVE